MRILTAAVLVVVSLSGCIGSESTQDAGPTGQIDGAVLNHILVPYAGVPVHLVELDIWTRTTELGGFSFYDVPVGFHTVEVELDDGRDRDIIAVEEDHVSKLILQVFPAEVDEPHVTVLSDSHLVQLAMPGEVCEDCKWRTQLRHDRPEQVEIHVEWDGRHPVATDVETHVEVRLTDQNGKTLIGPLGRDDVVRVGNYFVLEAAMDGSEIPAEASTLQLHFTFDADNELPHPDFEMRSAMCLHYVEDAIGPTACTPG